jgi:Ceramidase
MDWKTQIFAYCERGTNAAFWAEPLNAVSNLAFIVVAYLALQLWHAKRSVRDGAIELGLIGIVFAVGVGSFLFHTFATRWALFADTIPISVFMISYLGYAVRRFANATWLAVGFSIAIFLTAAAAVESISCDGARCLNGSLGYVPAWAAMMIIGGALQASDHPAAKSLLTAAAIFGVSLIFRSVDLLVCAGTLIQPGWRAGTHAVWHVLNAAVLYILLRAAVFYGNEVGRSARS